MPEITANSFFATGDSPERAIKEISERFRVSKYNAGRLVMTESAYFQALRKKSVSTNFGLRDTRIKNNGDVETLTKQEDFNIATFGIEYRRLYKKIVQSNTDVELNKFVRTLLTKTKAGVIWSGNK